MEAARKLPSKEVLLETMDGEYHLFKTDILSGQCTYSTDKNLGANLETISAERAREIIEMNRRGEKPLSLLEDGKARPVKKPVDLLAGADLSRFDKAKKRRKNNPQRGGNGQQTNRRNSRDGQNTYQTQNVPRMTTAGCQTATGDLTADGIRNSSRTDPRWRLPIGKTKTDKLGKRKEHRNET